MKGNRILIVAMGRSGGYGLGNWISRELNLKFIHEPMINLLDDSGKGIVTKYLITELEAYKRNPWNGTDMESNIKGYDKRIGLIREGDRECADDLAVQQFGRDVNDLAQNLLGRAIGDEFVVNGLNAFQTV